MTSKTPEQPEKKTDKELIFKLVTLATKTKDSEKRSLAIEELWAQGYFLDASNHLWQKGFVPVFVQQLDPAYEVVSAS